MQVKDFRIFYDETIESCLVEVECDDVSSLIEIYRKQAIAAQKLLNSLDLQEMEVIGKENFFHIVGYLYKYLCLFPSEEIYNRFQRLGIKKKHIIRFISINELFTELSKLEDIGVRANRVRFMYCVRMHLYVQIHGDVDAFGLMTERYDKKENAGSQYKLIRNLLRRREYSKGKPKVLPNSVDDITNKHLDLLEEILPSYPAGKRVYVNSFNGQSEKSFLKAAIQSFLHPNLSKRQFCFQIYPLFYLLNPDKGLEAPEKLEDIKKYDHDPVLYAYSRITKIIGGL